MQEFTSTGGGYVSGAHDSQAMAYPIPDAAPGELDRLNEQIDRYDSLVSAVEREFGPVLRYAPEIDSTSPEAAPSSPFGERVQRLRRLNDALGVLIERAAL